MRQTTFQTESPIRDIDLVVRYFVDKYPRRTDLTPVRLEKMIYLADWRAAITTGQQLTTTQWRFDALSATFNDMLRPSTPIDFSSLNQTEQSAGVLGVFKRHGKAAATELSPDQRAVLDHVIKEVSDLDFEELVGLIYATYPVLSQPEQLYLNLPDLARQYKETDLYKNATQAKAAEEERVLA